MPREFEADEFGNRLYSGGLDYDVEPDDTLMSHVIRPIQMAHGRLEHTRGPVEKPLEVPQDRGKLILGPGDSIGKVVNVGPGSRATVVQVRGDDTYSRVMTVTLITPNGFDPTDLPSGTLVNYQALISFGVEGAQAQFICDYLNGCSFSLAASWIRVDAINNGSTVAKNFGACVGLNALASPLAPQLSQFVTVGIGATAGAIIPPFGKRVKAMRPLNADGSPLTFTFLDSTGAVLASEQVGANQACDWIYIPCFAFQWRITNNSAAAPVSYCVIWELGV